MLSCPNLRQPVQPTPSKAPNKNKTGSNRTQLRTHSFQIIVLTRQRGDITWIASRLPPWFSCVMVPVVAGCWCLWPRRQSPGFSLASLVLLCNGVSCCWLLALVALWCCGRGCRGRPADPTSKAPQHTKQHQFDRTQLLNHMFKPKTA